MIKATYADKSKAVRIITETFDSNPSVDSVIGNRGDRKKKIGRLASYAFVKAHNRKGVFLSSNGMGTAFCFISDPAPFSLREVIHEVLFALSIPLANVIQALGHESYLKKHRYTGRHLYFWFFGVRKGGGYAGFELKDYLFDLSNKEKLHILLETSVERNKIIYERYGFQVYHTWKLPKSDKMLWFMKRDFEKTPIDLGSL